MHVQKNQSILSSAYFIKLLLLLCEMDVVHKMNEGYRACGALKSVLSNRGLGIKAKKYLFERETVPTALY